MSGPRVLLIGPGWIGGTQAAVASALTELGATVVEFCEDDDFLWNGQPRPRAQQWCDRLTERLLGRERFARHAFRAAYRVNDRRLRALGVTDYDLVLVLSGGLVHHETVHWLKAAARAPLFLWQWDDPFMAWGNPPRARTEALLAYPAYDRIFVFDSYYVPRLHSHFPRVAVAHLPLAYDPQVYLPAMAAPVEPVYPLAFVGWGFAGRVEMLRPLRGSGLNLWGSGWGELAACVRGGVIPPAETARVYQRAGVVININHPQSVWSTNTRTFEVPGCGACLLTDAKRELADYFVPDREVAIFNSAAELQEKCRWYLAHPVERAALAAAGLTRARGEHTYAHRLRRVLACL